MKFRGGKLIKQYKEADYLKKDEIKESIIKLGTKAVETLIDIFNDDNENEKTTIADILGKIGDKRAVKHLIKALNDDDRWVIRYSAEALGKIGDPIAIKPLIRKLNYWDDDVCRTAGEALSKIGEPAIKPLLNAIKNTIKTESEKPPILRDEKTVKYAGRAISEINDPHAFEPLTELLKDKDIAIYAVDALGRIGDPRAFDSLFKIFSNKKSDIRHTAAIALGRIGDNRAVEPLIASLNEEDTDIRCNSAIALGRIGDKRAVEPLISALSEEDEWTRHEIICSLAALGDDRAIRPLKSLKKKVDEVTRETIVESLRKLKWKPEDINEKCSTYILEGDWEKLVELGEIAVEPIIETLTGESGYFNAEAAEALGKIGDVRAIAPLLEMYEKGENGAIKSLLDVLKKVNDKKKIKGINDYINWLEATLSEDINMSDLDAIREYSMDQAVKWWARQMKETAICDACNSVIRKNSGSIVGTWLRCDKCTDELFSDRTLNDLRDQPNYFGHDVLDKAREFYVRKIVNDIKSNKRVKKMMKKKR